MTRVVLLGLVGWTVACSYPPLAHLSVCAETPRPAACDLRCDPGGATTCPAGYHCTDRRTCDAQCTPGGRECGDGSTCSFDGRCNPSGAPLDATCGAAHVKATQIIPAVELLIDQSASMTAAYGTITLSRWDAMRSALVDPTTGVVANLASKVVFGATLYSSQSQGTGPATPPCPTLTSQPRALDNFAAIQQLLQNANPIQNTPTPESIDAVRASFTDHPPAPGSPSIIVLATDGLPDTCANANPATQQEQDAANAASVLAAQNAYSAGIKLFFLFVGDDVAGNHPQQMANAGAGLDPATGRAPFYPANNPAALTQAFNTIIDGVRSCDLALDGRVDPAQAPSGTVTLNGATLTYNTDWRLDPDRVTIHLLGAACQTLKTAASSTIDAGFPCGSVIF